MRYKKRKDLPFPRIDLRDGYISKWFLAKHSAYFLRQHAAHKISLLHNRWPSKELGSQEPGIPEVDANKSVLSDEDITAYLDRTIDFDKLLKLGGVLAFHKHPRVIKHVEIQERQRKEEALRRWHATFPNHCKICQGTGIHPELTKKQGVDMPCRCTYENICSQCGANPIKKDDVNRCSYCGWRYGERGFFMRYSPGSLTPYVKVSDDSNEYTQYLD